MRTELQINLKNLSNRGMDLYYNQESKELTQRLKSLIGGNNYSIKAHIRNVGHSSYIITGTIQTWLNLLCARCAYEFKEPINKHFEEKIILQKKLTRVDKPIRSNHFSELINTEDFTVTYSALFDIGDFLYELIAIEEPLRPLGAKTCDDDFFHCKHLEKMKQKFNENIKFSVQ